MHFVWTNNPMFKLGLENERCKIYIIDNIYTFNLSIYLIYIIEHTFASINITKDWVVGL